MRYSEEEMLRLEIERDMMRLRECNERAEEIVRDRGWDEKDDDFQIQIEEEAKRQWSEEMDWERRRFCLFDPDFDAT